MEADISILRKTGHFYFALTRIRHRPTQPHLCFISVPGAFIKVR
jgi:hypothetical protein